MIFDPTPAIRVNTLRNALTPIAHALRKDGAVVEMTEHACSGVHSIILTANHHCSTARAQITARALEHVAQQSGGEAYCTLHSRHPANLPAGEHGFALHYHVTRARAA